MVLEKHTPIMQSKKRTSQLSCKILFPVCHTFYCMTGILNLFGNYLLIFIFFAFSRTYIPSGFFHR
mgnify:FL=1